MDTKNNPKNNESIMGENYFADVIDIMYDNVNKTEQLYNEVHDKFSNNQPTGFSLGSTRTSTEMIKALSEIRATSVSAAKSLFDAKKSVVELELKKQNQTLEEDKASNDKEFIRAALAEIKTNGKTDFSTIPRALANKEDNGGSKMVSTILQQERNQLDKVIQEKIKDGSIKLTSNEKAMKYDFNNEVEPVYDSSTEMVKAVKKGTNEEITEYPTERFQIGKITRVDIQENKAYSDNGKSLRITTV